MSASNYRPSLALVLAHEGGYSNHPNDPGGATNRGITQRVYDAYREYNRQKKQSVKLILNTEVTDIYARNYWKLVRGDSLPIGLDYAVFDFAVNSGVSRAIKYLQRLVGVGDDGSIGFVTLAAIDNVYNANAERLIAQYCSNRLAFLKQLPTFKTFGIGWTRRVIGYQTGVQQADTGVVDYATFMARDKKAYIMPSSIAETAKAFAPETPAFNVIGPIVGNAVQLRQCVMGK